MYHKYIKRFFDIILSLCCIIVSSPILLATALLVRIKLGSPVIFKQERPGYHNEIFTLYKFRSMTDVVDENGDLLPDKERLPRFGQMLRSTSLDELPEFFNILFGHMSFVGPRPLLKQYIDFYSARQKRRADVRPGLTGLAQVNGRNAISWEEKFEFDLEYVDSISFLTDIKIILKTVTKVLKRAGISAQESVTMYAFQGTKKDQFSKYKKAGHLKILFSSVADQVEFIDTFRYAAGRLGVKGIGVIIHWKHQHYIVAISTIRFHRQGKKVMSQNSYISVNRRRSLCSFQEQKKTSLSCHKEPANLKLLEQKLSLRMKN